MNQQISLLLLMASLFMPAAVNAADITGSAFRDYNDNGVQEVGEPGIGGVEVKAYGTTGAMANSTITAADGSYSLTGLTAGDYRVEFTLPTALGFLSTSVVGGQHASSVQFVTAGASGVDAAFFYLADYVPNAANAQLVANVYRNGNNTVSTASLLRFDYDGTNLTTQAIKPQTGTTWGLAYSRWTKKLYSAAFLKRNTGLGPNGLGAIYVSDVTSSSANASLFVNLVDHGIDVGTIGDNAARGLPSDEGLGSADPEAYGKVGKVGLGDLDISDDESALWVTNLYTRELLSIGINPDGTSGTVTAHPIPTSQCNPYPADARPFAVKVFEGKVYVGTVCSAETTQDMADLSADVFRFDPADSSFSNVLSFPLDYTKGLTNTNFPDCTGWNPWVGIWTDTDQVKHPICNAGFRDLVAYPTPLLADIEFDTNGDMVMSFIDRTSHQVGAFNYWPDWTGAPTDREVNNHAGGDLLRAEPIANGNFALESGGAVHGLSGAANGQGPGGGEFYSGEKYGLHEETIVGGVALLRGTGELVVTGMDAVDVGKGGVYRMSNTNGTKTGGYELYSGTGTFSKSAGLGDLELLADPPPLQIGNRVWKDTNGNGIQEPGAAELGISGVQVTLWADANGDGVIDASDGMTPVATTTTASDGSYLFGGPASPALIQPQTTYQVRVSLTDSALPRGFFPTFPNAYSGLADGNDDIRDSDGDDGTLVATYSTVQFSTAGNGENDHTYDFGFTDVPTSAVIGDFGGGLSMVPEVLAGLLGDAPEAAAVSGLLGVWDPDRAAQLGDASAQELLAALTEVLDPDGDGHVAVVRWETLMEHGTIGFYVERQDTEGGPWQRLSGGLLQGLLTAREGGDYLLLDPQAEGQVSYRLLEQEAWGTQRSYGPWRVDLAGVTGMGPKRAAVRAAPVAEQDTSEEHWGDWRVLGRSYAGRPRKPGEPELGQILARGMQQRPAVELRAVAPDRLRLRTADGGLYRIGAAEIGALTRWSEQDVHKRLHTGKLHLSSGGQSIPYRYDRAERALYFAAEPYRSYETLENVYTLAPGRGKGMKVRNGKGPAAGSPGVFRDTLVLEKDIWEQAWAQHDEQGDVWFWNYLYANRGATATAPFALDLPGVADSGEVRVRVYLQGASDLAIGYDHRVRLALNGADLGVERTWNGLTAQTIEAAFDAGALSLGKQLTVEGTAVDSSKMSYFWVDRIEVEYPRVMHAHKDQLIVRDAGPGVVTVDGLSGPDIVVIDRYGLPNARWRKDTTVSTAADGSWQVTVDLKKATDLLVSARALSPVAEGDEASALKTPEHSVDYLIISPRAFSAGARALAEYRNGQYRTEIAWLDDIYDEFSAGRTDSAAIEAFLDYLHAEWREVPQYVVLLGRGTFDHRNDRKGLNESWIPLRLADTPWGVTGSDGRYADVDGDKIGEFALGRIGAMNDAEVRAYVAKLQAYEQQAGGPWSRQAAAVADNPDDGGPFHTNSDTVSERLGSYGFPSERLYHPTHAPVGATLKANWGAGAYGLVNYVGHGSSVRLGNTKENFLDVATAKVLNNGAQLPMFVALTCAAGHSGGAGVRSLTDALVLNAGGGAVAGYSATGLSWDAQAHVLNLALLDSLAGRSRSLGEAAVEAATAAKAAGADSFMLDIYQTSGDPAVRLRP